MHFAKNQKQQNTTFDMVLFIVLPDVCLAVSTKGTIEREESGEAWTGAGWSHLMPWITTRDYRQPLRGWPALLPRTHLSQTHIKGHYGCCMHKPGYNTTIYSLWHDMVQFCPQWSTATRWRRRALCRKSADTCHWAVAAEPSLPAPLAPLARMPQRLMRYLGSTFISRCATRASPHFPGF